MVAILPAALVVIFGLLFAVVKREGGYQAAGIHDGHEANGPPDAEA
jgi:hypothetical protein